MNPVPTSDLRLLFLQNQFPLTPHFEDFHEPAKDLFTAIVHQKVSKARAAIQKLDEDDLDYQEPQKGLTFLMACVIIDDYSTAQYLISRKVSVLKKDSSGWTAFHHAVIKGNQTMLNLLKSAEEVKDQNPERWENHCGLSCLQMRKLLERTLPLSERPVFHYFDEDSQQVIHNASAHKFFELTQSWFVPESLVSSDYLINLWKNAPSEGRDFFDFLKSYVETHYAKSKTTPCPLYLKKTPPIGWGVFADRHIEPGEIVVHYAGEYVGKDPHSAYYAGDVDGKNFRNLGPLVNDGIPNLVPVHVTIDHLPTIVYMSISHIKKGRELLINYGFDHSVKQGPYRCKDLETLVQYITGHGGIEKVLSMFKEGVDEEQYLQNFHLALRVTYLKSILGYIFQTPSVLLDLVFHRCITSKDFSSFTQFESYFNPAQNREIRILLDRICHIAGTYEEKIGYLIKSPLESDMLLYQDLQDFLLSINEEFDIVTRLLISQYLLELMNLNQKDCLSAINKQGYREAANHLFQILQIFREESLPLFIKSEKIQALYPKLPEKLRAPVLTLLNELVSNNIKNENAYLWATLVDKCI